MFGQPLANPAAGEESIRAGTFVVAAYDSRDKSRADYVCVGTDDQVEIQRAIDDLPAGGGSVVLLEGTFELSAAIRINRNNVQFRGQGHATVIRAAAGSETIDIFDLGDGVTQRNWITISDLCISSVNYKTLLSAIAIDDCFGVWITNVYIERQYRGIWILNSHQVTVQSSDLRDIKENGIVIETAYRVAVEWRLIDVWMDNPNVENIGSGIWWLGGEGLYVQHVTIQRFNTGFLIRPSDDYECRWGFIEGLLCDSNLDVGIKVSNANAPYGDVHGVTFIDCWSSTHPHFGVLIEAPSGSAVTTIRMVGCKVMNNGWHGIYIAGGVDNTVDDCDVFSNGTETPNTFDGIYVVDNIGEVSIRNNRCGNGADHGAVQRYGITIGLGTSDNYIILGNDVRNNSTGGILDLGAGLNKIVDHNLA